MTITVDTPRFLHDKELKARFGLSDKALACLRKCKGFPQKDTLIHRTDSRAIEHFFDQRAGLVSLQVANGAPAIEDGEENFQ